MSEPHRLNSGLGPAWHPDPTGRFGLRWWDGQGWSSHVHGPTGYSYDPVREPGAAASPGAGAGPAIGLLAASLLPTALTGLLSWLVIMTALGNPIEGMVTLSFWFMSALSGIVAAVLAIVALAVSSDGKLTHRARRTVSGLGIGVIAVNAALIVAPAWGV